MSCVRSHHGLDSMFGQLTFFGYKQASKQYRLKYICGHATKTTINFDFHQAFKEYRHTNKQTKRCCQLTASCCLHVNFQIDKRLSEIKALLIRSRYHCIECQPLYINCSTLISK